MELAELPDTAGRMPSSNAPRGARELEAVYDIPVTVSAVLGKATMQVSQLLKLGRGAVVELDRKLGEAIDIYVNNRLVARGEVVMVDDSRLGVTMTEIVKADRDRRAMTSLARDRHARPDHRLACRRTRPGGAHRDRARREARPGGRRATPRWRGCAPMRASIWCCATWRTMSAPWCARWPPNAWRCRWSPAAPATMPTPRRSAIRDGAREFLPLPPDPDLIAAILEAAAGESHAMVVRDPAMQAAVQPRRAGGRRRKPRC